MPVWRPEHFRARRRDQDARLSDWRLGMQLEVQESTVAAGVVPTVITSSLFPESAT
jgi:hypothetical protein